MNSYAYHVKHKNGWGTGCGPSPTHCHKCSVALPDKPDIGGTGYGCGDSEPVTDGAMLEQCGARDLKPGEYIERSPAICYACCAADDRAYMIEHGRITAYLIHREGGERPGWYVTNWPGTLEFPCTRVSTGRHKSGRVRRDAWFTGPDGAQWHAVNAGDDQIARCRRLKGRT